jgi:hypothetical protein
MGAGERKKSIVGPVAVNVYAIGLYVDASAAKAAGSGVTDTQSAAQVLKSGSFSKTLRLVMARTGMLCVPRSCVFLWYRISLATFSAI